MNTLNLATRPTLTRRNFLKAVGLTTAASMVPSMLTGCGFTENPGAISMAAATQTQVDTDVLIIGGGMAGAFAAITAKEQGLNVTLVDKGTVGRSGATPWANTFSVFDEAAGYDRDEWIAGVSTSSDYVNNKENIMKTACRWGSQLFYGIYRSSAGRRSW